MENTTGKRPCPRCGYVNRHGIIFCEQCGLQVGTGVRKTARFITKPQAKRETAEVPENAPNLTETIYSRKRKRSFQKGTSVFEETATLRIDIEGSHEPLFLRPFEAGAIVFGRNDPEDSYQPDVDLEPYDAHHLGISRRHAALTLTGKRLDLRDLKSTNGTYLNGVLLDPNEPHQIRDGDEIRLGNMVLHLSFQD